MFAGLKHVFATQNDVLMLASSGTGAMEAAVVNLVPRGGKAIVLESGKFAERWRKIVRDVRHRSGPLRGPLGAAVRGPAKSPGCSQQHPDAVAVFSTLLETSTGVGHDIEAIGRVVGPSKAAAGRRRHQRRRARCRAAPTPGASTCWWWAHKRR